MPIFYDQLNRAVNISDSPKRIISIVPSQTELLFYIGLKDEVIGVTNFCNHPASLVKRVKKIGGTKQLKLQAIHQLQPDLIIGNKEENDRNQVEQLMKQYPVWISDITDLPGAMQMINSVGAITGRVEEAGKLGANIKQRFNAFIRPVARLRAAYFIWRKPYMVAGSGTFINSMLQLCNIENVFEIDRYPQITAAELIDAAPDFVLLSSEPYPFAQKHIAEFKVLLPNARILLVDGEMFSWYGSRLLDAPGYFTRLLENFAAI